MKSEQCGNPTHHTHMCHFKRLSWSAITTGALVGIGLSFLLNLFSVAIGLSIVTTTQEGLISLAVGGFIGLIIGAIVSMFVAGFTAGYLGRPYCVKRNLGVLYGFTTWCLALILMVLLTSYMGRYIKSYSDFISGPRTTIFTTHKEAPVVILSSTTQNTTATVEPKTTEQSLGYSPFLIFTLFFISALASCFGGHYGMSCRCDDDSN